MNAPVTRRALLGATATVGFAAMPAVAVAETAIPASGTGDAALIAAATSLRVLRAREFAAWAALPDDHPDDFPPFVACGQLADEVRENGEALAGVAAVTPAGLAAKASAMLALVGRGCDAEVEAFTEHAALTASVLRDAARLGMAGVVYA